MTKKDLAKWLHDNYEAVAKEQNWNTQQSCKVEFDTLPDANKRTMIEIADRLLNFNLLRLHFVVGRSEQLKCRCKKAQFTRTVDADFNPLCGRCGKAL
jgi:hypothetical protein